MTHFQPLPVPIFQRVNEGADPVGHSMSQPLSSFWELPKVCEAVNKLLFQKERTYPSSLLIRSYCAYISEQAERIVFEGFAKHGGGDPLLKKLDEFANLPIGWEYGEGGPTLPHVSQIARSIYQDSTLFQFKADAFPCADGSLHLVFYADDRSAEVQIETDGVIDLCMEEKRNGRFVEVESPENVPRHEVIPQVADFLLQELSQWDSFGLSIQGTMTTRSVNLIARASRTRIMGPGYLLSTRIVSNQEEPHFASISPVTIPAS